MRPVLDSVPSPVLAVVRREIGAFVDSPVAWVATGLFVLLLHGTFFFLGYPLGDLRLPAFWAGNLASLDTLYAWVPPLYCVLAPALTMGAWAEEARSGTDELLFTQPLRTRDVVLGKFFACWLSLGLVTTCAVVPVALVVASLGPLDWGTVCGGLVGVWMLAAVCVSVGLFASALSSEQFVAFGVGALVLAVLWGAGLFVRSLPSGLAEAAWYASPTLHFQESGARGLFDARDVVYYGLFAAAFLHLNALAAEGRRWRR